jgi:hypothetical protein
MSSLPTLALKSLNRIFIWHFGEFVKHTFQFLVEAVLRIISFILCWGMNVQSNDMTLATS